MHSTLIYKTKKPYLQYENKASLYIAKKKLISIFQQLTLFYLQMK